MESIPRDLRFAARGLRRSPAFTAAAVVTLALGIGATTAVFSVVYGILFRPLPFPNAGRLVRVVQLLPERPGQSSRLRAGLTPDQITEWRATSRTLAEIGYYSPRAAVMTGAGAPVRLHGAQVSVSLFRALGVPPFMGRLFAGEDEQPGNEHVVVLGHDTWRARFGSSEAILDHPITMNDRAYRVIGVMPEGFGFPSIASSSSLDASGEFADAPEFWMPLVARPRPASPAARGMSLVRTYALLGSGVTVEQATAEANTLMPAHVKARYPVELVNARVEEARAVRPTLLLFQAAVLFVLFIACVNVVNLLLARGARSAPAPGGSSGMPSPRRRSSGPRGVCSDPCSPGRSLSSSARCRHSCSRGCRTSAWTGSSSRWPPRSQSARGSSWGLPPPPGFFVAMPGRDR